MTDQPDGLEPAADADARAESPAEILAHDAVHVAVEAAAAEIDKAAPALAPVVAAEQTPVEAAIDRWVDSLRGSPISWATDAWNHLASALPALKALIKGL